MIGHAKSPQTRCCEKFTIVFAPRLTLSTFTADSRGSPRRGMCKASSSALQASKLMVMTILLLPRFARRPVSHLRNTVTLLLTLAFLPVASHQTPQASTVYESEHERQGLSAEIDRESRNGPTWRVPFSQMPTIERFYEQPEGHYGKGHRGIDFASTESSLILAPASGTVHFAGVVAEKPAVSVRADGDIIYTFEPATTELSVGDSVAQGQPLAHVAVGGHCDGSCVHFGVRVSGEYVNPLRFLVGRPVLLPLQG